MADQLRTNVTRRTFAAGALGGGLLLGSGRAPAIAQGRRDLRVGIFGGDFGNLGPFLPTDIQGALIANSVFDTLTDIDYANRRIVPNLAEAWTNPDPLTWRIKLREGVQWQKGYGEVTADDVVYCWNYHLENRSWLVASVLFPLDTVKAEGKYIVEVKTKTPFGPFPGATMVYGGRIVSAKAHREMGNAAYSATPVGMGPYQIESKRGTEIILSRHPGYWRPGLPKLDRIVYRAIPDSNTRLQALLRNELDFITHPEQREVAGLRRNSNVTVASTPGWTWDYTQFNLADRAAPHQNKLVRQAISYAIDREAIVNEIYSGEALPTDNQIPAGFLGHRGQLLKYPKNADLRRARELMAQAGVRGYEVEVLTSDKDWLRKELELVAAMVSQIGINFKIRNLDIGGFNNLWINGRYDVNMEDITLVSPDPDATSWWFLHSRGSVSRYRSPEMDVLLDDARSETDQAKREAMYHRIVDVTLDECPIIYHCNTNNIQVYNKNLKGFVPTPQENREPMIAVEWG